MEQRVHEHSHSNAYANLVLITVKTEMTDSLVVLFYHTSHDSFPIYLSVATCTVLTKSELWMSTSYHVEDTCKDISFVCAIIWCDAMSNVYGLGKATALEMFSPVMLNPSEFHTPLK